MKLLYSIPSLGFDESKGPPSLMFVTHHLFLDTIPYQFPEDSGFFITNGWLGDQGEWNQRITILDPNKQLWLDTEPKSLELTQDQVPYTALTFLQGLKFEMAGEYRVEVSLNGEDMLSYPFFVEVLEDEKVEEEYS